ncbi:MAG: DUF4124 domain-containing protein [Wenzhouxiangellaceae bacterium]|nr:DUF4124 domain-containing protein [Wenzhouxiangellaceae bacterium]
MPVFTPVRAACLLLSLGLSLTATAQTAIYKTVDENGNVVYTDQRPDDNSEPMKLPELSVVSPVDIGDSNAVQNPEQAAPAAQAVAVPTLRLLSPSHEQTFQNTGGVLPVSIAVDGELPPGSQLAYLVDGEVRQTGTSTRVSLEEVFRGEHQVQVQLRAANGRVLAGTEPVTVFMHQTSIRHPN